MPDYPEIKERLTRLGCCVIIPSYDNSGTVGTVVKGVLDYCDDVIVVNDGSSDDTERILKSFGSSIRVLTHPFNWGKGVALRNGFSAASESGFKYAITIDSDGQHFPDDIPVFADAIEAEPDCLLVGARNLKADGMPSKNTFANKFSNFWYKLETGIPLTDTQSGYRLYPLEKIDLSGKRLTSGYEFELEMIVFAAWNGVRVKNVPVRVYYPPKEERVSHFKPFRDFFKISVLNTLLVLYCFFWRWPAKFFKSLTKDNVKNFIDNQIIHSKDTNLRISEAVALGIFMGIVPIWGYQMVVAFALAHLLKLNKIITLVASNISIPPMIPFILFGSYWAGCKILSQPLLFSFRELTLEKVGTVLLQYVLGSFVFGAACAFLFGLIVFAILAFVRKNPSKSVDDVNR